MAIPKSLKLCFSHETAWIFKLTGHGYLNFYGKAFVGYLPVPTSINFIRYFSHDTEINHTQQQSCWRDWAYSPKMLPIAMERILSPSLRGQEERTNAHEPTPGRITHCRGCEQHGSSHHKPNPSLEVSSARLDRAWSNLA